MPRICMRLSVVVVVVSALACATNPVTGKRELSLISEAQEIQMGRAAAQNDLKRVGETIKPDAQTLVRTIGTQMAARSERPQLPWEFHLLDDAAVNAFAYPGGFIFVTRGLLTHLNSEAELAQVIGHEIGHVTAKHTVHAMSQQQAAQLFLVAGSVLSERVAKFGDVLGTGAGLLFLKFGRDDEIQADDLGFGYALAQRYDVREAEKVFATLARLGDETGARVPEWASTHPDPGNRAQVAQKKVAALAPGSLANTRVNRNEFLRMLDGMMFGENPRLGYFLGARFLHPDLRFELTMPGGWKSVNLPEAVVSQSPQGDAQVQLVLGQGTPAQVLQQFLSQDGITVTQSGQTTINGLPAFTATFDGQTEGGVIKGITAAIQYENATYLMVGLVTEAAAQRHAPAITGTLRSFRALTDPALINVQPARLELVTLPDAMTGLAFTQRYPSTVPAEQIYVINGIAAGTNLSRGTLLKRVVGGLRK
ncbi:MAG: M48 family metalloprotease [Vicinamibacterales bacterium]